MQRKYWFALAAALVIAASCLFFLKHHQTALMAASTIAPLPLLQLPSSSSAPGWSATPTWSRSRRPDADGDADGSMW